MKPNFGVRGPAVPWLITGLSRENAAVMAVGIRDKGRVGEFLVRYVLLAQVPAQPGVPCRQPTDA